MMEVVPMIGTSRRELMMPDNSRRRVAISTATAAEHMTGAQPAAVERWPAASEAAALNGDAAAAKDRTATTASEAPPPP